MSDDKLWRLRQWLEDQHSRALNDEQQQPLSVGPRYFRGLAVQCYLTQREIDRLLAELEQEPVNAEKRCDNCTTLVTERARWKHCLDCESDRHAETIKRLAVAEDELDDMRKVLIKTREERDAAANTDRQHQDASYRDMNRMREATLRRCLDAEAAVRALAALVAKEPKP